jgi:hypothetical protein
MSTIYRLYTIYQVFRSQNLYTDQEKRKYKKEIPIFLYPTLNRSSPSTLAHYQINPTATMLPRN